MAFDPEGFFARCAARRGDPFLVTMPSVGEVLTTGHPEGAREIFSAPADTFEPLHVNPVGAAPGPALAHPPRRASATGGSAA